MIWTPSIQQRSLFGIYMIQVRFIRFQMKNIFKHDLISESHVILMFVFISGCQCVPARLPEQYGLRLETAQLHAGRSWGEYTASDTRTHGLLRWINADLSLIVDFKRIERHCFAAGTTHRPEEDWLHARTLKDFMSIVTEEQHGLKIKKQYEERQKKYLWKSSTNAVLLFSVFVA